MHTNDYKKIENILFSGCLKMNLFYLVVILQHKIPYRFQRPCVILRQLSF